ncbi:MAG: methionyl-tRNA formyltransferase [Patescibacteria group bacterium]
MSSQKEVKKIRIIFMGTPEFSLPGLRALIKDESFEIVGVLTQPDKPFGRKQILTPPSVKVLALENNLEIFQPDKIKTEIENIKSLEPDLIVVIAYGKIIPQEILDIPTFGCINVHASLLPKYRGAACLNAPILNGDKETGVTIMKMEAGLDTGPILQQSKMELNGQETLGDVHDRLSELGAKELPSTLHDWIAGNIEAQVQDNFQASFVKTLTKEDGQINWEKQAEEIERMIRAFTPWPGVWTELNGEILKIISVEHKIAKVNKVKTGQLFLDNGRLLIQCRQNALVILELQLAGKRAMDSSEFINGYKDKLK